MERLKTSMKEQGGTTKSTNSPQSLGMTSQELARFIDHTLLKPGAIETQFDQLCAEALKYNFYSVCVNSGAM